MEESTLRGTLVEKMHDLMVEITSRKEHEGRSERGRQLAILGTDCEKMIAFAAYHKL